MVETVSCKPDKSTPIIAINVIRHAMTVPPTHRVRGQIVGSFPGFIHFTRRLVRVYREEVSLCYSSVRKSSRRSTGTQRSKRTMELE